MRDATTGNMIAQNELDAAYDALIPILGITFGLMFFVGLL